MSTRKELISSLKDELEKYGFWEKYEDPFSEQFKFSQNFLDNIRYVANDNQIVKMKSILTSQHFECAKEAFEAFKWSGLLKIKPAVVDDGNVPSLFLSWGNYLHWFRGYYFQISYTHQGIGEVYAGADRLDIAKRTLYYLNSDEEKTGESAYKFITVACMLPVLLHFDIGKKLLNENQDLVNEFIDKTCERDRLYDANIGDFMNFISVKQSIVQPSFPADFVTGTDKCFAVRLLYESFGYGLLVFEKNRILVTVSDKDKSYITYQLDIPNWFYLKDEYEDHYVSDHEILLKIMVRALLACAGFRADYMCMYPIGANRGDLNRIDYNIPDTATDWYEVENYITKFVDEFVK